MSLPLVMALFVLGIIIIIKSANWFVESAAWIALRAGMPQILVGATIVSLGTTLPELSISTYASWRDIGGVAVGNALGSGVFNIAVILGGAAVIKDFPVWTHFFSRKSFTMLMAALITFLLCVDGMLDRHEGLLLFLIALAYTGYLVLKGKRAEKEHSNGSESPCNAEETQDSSYFSRPLGRIIAFVVGAAGVAFGSRILIYSITIISEAIGVPAIVTSLTLVSLGTSLPELVTAITSLLKGHKGLIVGNILGANFFNITLVLGISSMINPLNIKRATLIIDFPMIILCIVLLIIFGYTKRKMERWEGLVYLALYLAYLTILFTRYSQII